MNDTELRELDAWIAIHLFGWIIFPTTKEWIDAGSPTGWTIEVSDQSPHNEIAHYSTNRADAMLVLEKCAKKETVTIEVSLDGKQFWIARLDTESRNEDFCKVAETLPLAICRFAKQIFSK